MDTYEHISRLLRQDRIAEAIAEADRALKGTPDDSRLWYLHGKIHWRTGNRSEAMSCYSRAVALDPDSPAAFALEQARDIADFFNPDLLNP